MLWDVGAHTLFEKNIRGTLEIAVRYGMYTTQFFMGNPYSYNRANISKKDIEESNNILNMYPMNVFTHFPYVANLAGSTTKLAWNGDEEQDGKTNIVIAGVQQEIDTLSLLDSKKSGIVIHPGSFKDTEKGLEAVVKTINRLKFPTSSRCKVKLLLENCAGEGTKLCKNLKEIQYVLERVDKKIRKNVGVCIDTCHLFSSGELSFSTTEEIDRFFSDFDTMIGLENFSLLHLNDSEKPLGCKVDRHACLGTGCIWGKSFDSLIHLLEKCKEHGIPAVLETHGMDMITLSCLSGKYKV